jgi:protein-S-isoprenylcysteine O-methyltransferase Ste14
LLWISFGAGHSLLANTAVRKRVIKRIGAFERLAYNGIAVCHLALILLAGAWLLGRAPRFDWPPGVRLLFGIVQASGLVGVVLALREYDIGRFIGSTQIREGVVRLPDRPEEPFVVDGMHRYVRHPLYAASIVFLVGGATGVLGLATAIFATAYFAIGMKFEDRKLARLYGDPYLDYRARTPALVPFWRR